jgi:hypothetical protein
LQGNIIVEQRQVLKILELYDQPDRPENLVVEPEEEIYEDKECPYILQSEVGKGDEG